MGRSKSLINGKYQWVSRDFDSWLKEQTMIAEKNGYKGSTAIVSHKLYHDFILPNKICLDYPKIRIKCKKKHY